MRYILDLLGVGAFAVSGALAAASLRERRRESP
jgi:uncharacterized membrane protein YeiH